MFREEMALMLAFSSKSKLNCEKGSALLLVIILMLVFSLLSVSMLMLLTTSTQISGNYRLDLRTLYIADAGLEHAIRVLREYPDPTGWAANDPGEVTFGDGKYEAEVDFVSYPDPSPSIHAICKIVSTGTIGGFKRYIESYVKLISMSGGANYAAVTTSWQTIPDPGP